MINLAIKHVGKQMRASSGPKRSSAINVDVNGVAVAAPKNANIPSAELKAK